VIIRRVPVADLAPGPRRLDERAAHYVARVLRLRAGDAFIAFDPSTALEADATVVRVDGAGVEVELGPPRAGRARAARDVIWLQGLPKGEKSDAVVRDATELGATRIAFVLTERTVVKLDAPGTSKRRARWKTIAEQAARQSGRSDTPAVDAPASWSAAIAAVDARAARFCLHDGADDDLGPLLLDALEGDAPLAFACGPEGGLTEEEVAIAERNGWRGARIGASTLRTETVAAAVLGAVRVFGGGAL
jgi:16S rRNA (uracil1498-N3)-methyltransferase